MKYFLTSEYVDQIYKFQFTNDVASTQLWYLLIHLYEFESSCFWPCYYAKNGTGTSFLQIRTAKQTGRAYCAYNSYDYYYLSNYQLSVSVSTALSLGMLFDKQCKETKNG